MIGMFGNKTLYRHNHTSQRAFHICCATPMQETINHSRLKRRSVPLRQRAGRHHIGMTCKNKQGRLRAAASPEVGGVFKHHAFNFETQRF
ncbi:Uncharacterised protein [Vibrio cholerae]|uniref:Uncharacterized protein n=1 Tax=Vibrio cholerae TaxID=666 RepID=A0A655ZYF5_VIBCL|nr:Uncharacterised protein [Vibrio cholerae]CSB28030.1 Uncharacterised protein [Vibrio cholerae]CSB96411.1 Uncharacterised protein [Vibrio cholerae]CSC40630.1 Uncharacterised protein [Vibrio cholerae]CSC43687.1 Uncharacterised protein [Vibrio cholerae]